jgi:hypothetical protein
MLGENFLPAGGIFSVLCDLGAAGGGAASR